MEMSPDLSVMTTTSKKSISFLTGTRADFGKLKPLIQSVADSRELRYEVVATGMHMLKKYGLTIGEIYKSGFENVFPIFNQESSSAEKMDITLANTIIPLSHYLNEKQPDLLIIHGDRIETLAGAIKFGDGNAARRFSEVISQDQFWEVPLQKQFIGLDVSGSGTTTICK